MASIGMTFTIRYGMPMYGQIVAQSTNGAWYPFIPVDNNGRVVIKGNNVTMITPSGDVLAQQSYATAPIKDYNSMYISTEPISPNKLDTDASGKPILKEYVNYCYMVKASYDDNIVDRGQLCWLSPDNQFYSEFKLK